MRQRSALMTFLLGTGAASSLALLASCTDNTTGQDPEPYGPLQITRLTLLDGNRGVFTDTSAPLDCKLDSLKNTPACISDPFTDTYSTQKSPPTTDSGAKLRVVFNKIPGKLNGQDIETAPADGSLPTSLGDLQLKDPSVVQLTCEGSGCGVPASYNSLQLTGSALSPNPLFFDYGPALQLQVGSVYNPTTQAVEASADPLAALEPATTYHVTVNPAVSGRDLIPVLLDDRAKALLTFTTEPLTLLSLGFGAGDGSVKNGTGMGDGTTGSPYTIVKPTDQSQGLAYDGVIAVALNAAIDQSVFLAGSISAYVSVGSGPAVAVAAKLTNGIGKAGMAGCSRGNQRTLYIAPVAGQWVANSTAATVNVTLRGADVRDVSQLAGHPAKAGRHVLSGDVVLQASISSSGTSATVAKALAAADVLACQ